MRRIVLILVLVAVVGVAGFLLLRPKRAATPARGRTRSTSQDSTKPAPAKVTRKAARAAGTLKPTSKEERRAEAKRIRDEERKRKRELRRQERERRRRLKSARSRSGRRGRRIKGQYYTLKAVVSLGSESYALIDGRRAVVGDVIMGRKIVAILADRVEVEAFGRRTVVRVGESLMPPSYSPRKGR